MGHLIGQVFTGLIIDENEEAYFIQKDGVTFRLDKSEGEWTLGSAVEGFAYQNQKDENRFTTKIPTVLQGHYDFAEVVATRRDLGAFVNIGLPDKEIVVSLDELPTMRELWPRKGDRVLVSLFVDEQQRLWGRLAEEAIFQAMARPVEAGEWENKNVTATAYRLKVAGTLVITDENHLGFLHPSERYIEPRVGEVLQARVIGVGRNGILNLSVKPRSHEVISADAQMILTFLEKSAAGKIPFTDKSDPAEIQKTFAISKGQFKRALGSLMKAKRIEQKDGFTILIK